MTPIKNSIVTFTMLMCIGAMAPACEPPGATCKESCATDEDCGSGLVCLSTWEGNQCFPAECRNCGSRTCYYIENFSEQEQGRPRTCTFDECR